MRGAAEAPARGPDEPSLPRRGRERDGVCAAAPPDGGTSDQPQKMQTSRGLGWVAHPAHVASHVLPPQV